MLHDQVQPFTSFMMFFYLREICQDRMNTPLDVCMSYGLVIHVQYCSVCMPVCQQVQILPSCHSHPHPRGLYIAYKDSDSLSPITG